MNHLAKLPDGELQIMQALWKCSIPAEKEDIIAQLDRKQPIAVTTLLTVLSRLSEKGYIRIDKHGRRSCYIPCITQQEYASMQSRAEPCFNSCAKEGSHCLPTLYVTVVSARKICRSLPK